ncbi:ATP-binding protein [Paenibacillus sp. TRM 82003]|nr:ATP-binding protein [Paenibacillus sp. TRM 82003]
MERVQLGLSASIGELERMGWAVDAFCEANGLGEKEKYALRLVCDEWVSNIVMHGYAGAPPPAAGEGDESGMDAMPIAVTLARVEDGRVRLEFADRAPAFDPLSHPAPDVSLPLEERGTGGLGIHFIRKMMDGCEYERVGNINKLILYKRIDDREEPTDEPTN